MPSALRASAIRHREVVCSQASYITSCALAVAVSPPRPVIADRKLSMPRRSGSAGGDAAFDDLVEATFGRGFFETGIFWPSISVANDGREPSRGWEPRPCALEDRRLDSVIRCAAIEQAVTASSHPFSWVTPPVRNWNTRLAVEMNPSEGWIGVLGFEPCSAVDAAPVTAPFTAQAAPVREPEKA